MPGKGGGRIWILKSFLSLSQSHQYQPLLAVSGPKHCQSASLFVSARYSFQVIAIAMTGKTVAQWFDMLASRRRRAATTACAST